MIPTHVFYHRGIGVILGRPVSAILETEDEVHPDIEAVRQALPTLALVLPEPETIPSDTMVAVAVDDDIIVHLPLDRLDLVARLPETQMRILLAMPNERRRNYLYHLVLQGTP